MLEAFTKLASLESLAELAMLEALAKFTVLEAFATGKVLVDGTLRGQQELLTICPSCHVGTCRHGGASSSPRLRPSRQR